MGKNEEVEAETARPTNSTNANNGHPSARNNENDSEMDKLEDRLEQAGIVKPPDGAFGWAVVFASFCTNGIVDGIIFTVSASLVPRWERFFQNNSVTNVTSLLAGFYLISGPMASALANSFGCNTVAVAGSFVAAVGFLISALIPALPILYVAFGIIGGLGFGLVFLPAIVIVGQYFSEKRALATGMAVCGSGIGTAIFGQLNPVLLDYFDKIVGDEDSWRVFLLFLSAVTLCCAVFGCFFKPLKPSKAQFEQVERIANEFIGTGVVGVGEEEEEEWGGGRGGGGRELDDKINRRLSDTSKVTQGVEIERFVKPPQNGALSRRRVDSVSQRPFLSTMELLASRHALVNQDCTSASNANLAREVSKASIVDLNRPLSRMDVFYTGSSLSLAKRTGGKVFDQQRIEEGGGRGEVEEEEEGNGDGGATRQQHAAVGKSTLYLSAAGLHTLESAGRAGDGAVASKWTNSVITSMRSMLDIGLLQSPTFLVLALSGFLTLFCFFVPFAFIGELAAERISAAIPKTGIKNNTSASFNFTTNNGSFYVGSDERGESEVVTSQLLLVLLGLFNVFGRVLCGVVSDHPKVDPLVVSNAALIFGGVATAVAPFLNRLWMFAIYCFPFALGAASFAALRSIICVELLGIERLTSAFGMLMLFMGVAALLGPPFAKLLKNFTGSYGLSFHIMGIMMVVSGAMCIPLRRINTWENARERRKKSLADCDVGREKAMELRPLYSEN